MKRTASALAVALAFLTSSVFGLTDADTVALERLTKDYASWSYSGRPVEVRERLDYKSFEDQRQILLKLAEAQWDGIWGDYWRRREVNDLKTLRAFTPMEFWVHFHSLFKPEDATVRSTKTGRISVDVHAITEARGMAYVVYQVTNFGRNPASDDNFEVLRARWSDGEWRLVALPRVTTALRRQLEAAQAKKRSGG